MKGHNQIILNAATVMAAVQHYFDTVLFQPDESPLVTSFDKKDHYSGLEFIVGVSDEVRDTKGAE